MLLNAANARKKCKMTGYYSSLPRGQGQFRNPQRQRPPQGYENCCISVLYYLSKLADKICRSDVYDNL